MNMNIWHNLIPEGSSSTVPWEQLSTWDCAEFPWPWQKLDWTKIETSQRKYLVCWSDSGAFSLWELDGRPAAYLLKILVLDVNKGQGFGAELMKRNLETLSDLGFSSAALEVQVDNMAAIKLYKKLGWQEVRRVRSFYSNGSDALSMEIKL